MRLGNYHLLNGMGRNKLSGSKMAVKFRFQRKGYLPRFIDQKLWGSQMKDCRLEGLEVVALLDYITERRYTSMGDFTVHPGYTSEGIYYIADHKYFISSGFVARFCEDPNVLVPLMMEGFYYTLKTLSDGSEQFAIVGKEILFNPEIFSSNGPVERDLKLNYLPYTLSKTSPYRAKYMFFSSSITNYDATSSFHHYSYEESSLVPINIGFMNNSAKIVLCNVAAPAGIAEFESTIHETEREIGEGKYPLLSTTD